MQIFKMRTFKSVEIRNVKYLQMRHQRREILHREKRKLVACGFGESYTRFISQFTIFSHFKKGSVLENTDFIQKQKI